MNHFIDGGSNIGQTFDSFLSKTSKYDGWTVWCFEPSPRHFGALIANINKYQCRYKIVLCPFGLYDINGCSVFYEKINTEGDSFYSGWNRNITTEGEKNRYTLMSAQVDIVEFIDKNICDNDRAVLKLDVEGSEYPILRRILTQTSILHKIEGILVEWHDVLNNDTKALLIEEFKKIGIPLENWEL